MDEDEFPGAAPPYMVDIRMNPGFDPRSVPFTFVDARDESMRTWYGMWDPDQPEHEVVRRVVPDPATGVGPVKKKPMSGRSASASGRARLPRHPEEIPDMTDMTDAAKLRALADWFDRRDDDDSSEVQDDLREIARNLENTVEPTIALENALETVMAWFTQTDHGLPPESLEEATEVITGWLSER